MEKSTAINLMGLNQCVLHTAICRGASGIIDLDCSRAVIEIKSMDFIDILCLPFYPARFTLNDQNILCWKESPLELIELSLRRWLSSIHFADIDQDLALRSRVGIALNDVSFVYSNTAIYELLQGVEVIS